MRKTFTFCTFLFVSLLVLAQNPCPQVIPALQQWTGGKGTLTLPAQGSIVINTADKDVLYDAATILAQDLKELLGWEYAIRIGKVKNNEIYLSLSKPDEQLGEEGYVLRIANRVNVEDLLSKVYFGEREPCCRCSITRKLNWRKELPVTGRSSRTVALCSMWGASSSPSTI